MEIRKKVKIKVKDIKIQDRYKESPPRAGKMELKLKHYKHCGKFEEEIIVNKHNVLIDGYTSYLIAKQEGIKSVQVIKVIDCPWLSTKDNNIQDYETKIDHTVIDNDIHYDNDMYPKNIIKIILILLLLGIIAWGFGWFIAQIILMLMEVGG